MGYICDFEALSGDEEENGGHAEVKRPYSEFEAEILREEIMQQRGNKGKNNGNKFQQLVALQPQVNKIVVNEVEYVPYNPKLAENKIPVID